MSLTQEDRDWIAGAIRDGVQSGLKPVERRQGERLEAVERRQGERLEAVEGRLGERLKAVEDGLEDVREDIADLRRHLDGVIDERFPPVDQSQPKSGSARPSAIPLAASER
ncbi:MAG: hypothetical protein OXG58_01645 [Gemmatimonadetes bacterium]|nr:hypothetical protein [Gemmatimonadota bacterium]MCY3942549.1 hypothetical protein [Gemmatimonadota bacterium]